MLCADMLNVAFIYCYSECCYAECSVYRDVMIIALKPKLTDDDQGDSHDGVGCGERRDVLKERL
jgi:hypothetical protein